MVFRYAGRNISNQSVRHSRKFYNLIGRFYDWIYTEHIEGYIQSQQYLVDQCIADGDRVLDIGCGTGQIIQMVGGKARLVIGMDISRQMLKQALEKKRAGQPVYYTVADCRNIPLRTKFDKIVSSFMLVILPRDERRKAIAHFAEFVDSQGELIFLTAQDEISSQWLTREEWTEYCNQAGFSVVEIMDIHEYFRLVRARRV